MDVNMGANMVGRFVGGRILSVDGGNTDERIFGRCHLW